MGVGQHPSNPDRSHSRAPLTPHVASLCAQTLWSPSWRPVVRYCRLSVQRTRLQSRAAHQGPPEVAHRTPAFPSRSLYLFLLRGPVVQPFGASPGPYALGGLKFPLCIFSGGRHFGPAASRGKYRCPGPLSCLSAQYFSPFMVPSQLFLDPESLFVSGGWERHLILEV